MPYVSALVKHFLTLLANWLCAGRVGPRYPGDILGGVVEA